MTDRDSKGKFTPGNTAAKGKRAPREMTLLRNETKDQVIKLAFSLTKPMETLDEEMGHNGASRLEHLLYHAIKKHNHKFIKWVIEMAVGKPKQVSEDTHVVVTPKAIIRKSNGEEVEFKLNSEEQDSEE
jgi:hypothetical protein